MEHFLFDFLKSFWIGGTLTVPGVSGGTMAMVLGVYERLVSAVNDLRKGENLRKNIPFLAVFCMGGLLGAVAISGLVSMMLGRYPVQTVLFFTGTIAGGVPAILNEMKGQEKGWGKLFFFGVGLLTVCLISLIPNGVFTIASGGNILVQALGGVIAAVALVLPGISVSHMLYVLGIYESLTTAVSQLNFLVLIPFVIGLTLGVFWTASAVEYLLIRFKGQTYPVILGFVAGSVFQLLCSIGIKGITITDLILFAAGYLWIYLLFKYKKVGT